MDNKFLDEMLRTLKTNGIRSQAIGADTISLIHEGQETARIIANGGFITMPYAENNPAATQQIREMKPLLQRVKEYTKLMEVAPHVQSNSGNHEYRALSEFNGVLFAGIDLGKSGYQFATWERDGDGRGYTYGHYFGDNYGAAKEDFALRAGLVDQRLHFSQKQIAEMYLCMQEALSGDHALTEELERSIEEICMNIEDAMPALSDLAPLTEQQVDTEPEVELSKEGPLLSVRDTIPQSDIRDYKNETIILSPKMLNEESRIPRNQLWTATHGPGCTLGSFTGTVHLQHPIDGDIMCVHRSEILGVAKPEVVEMHLKEQEQTLEMGKQGL